MNNKLIFGGLSALALLVGCGSAKEEVSLSSTLLEIGKSYVAKVKPDGGVATGEQTEADVAKAYAWLETFDKPLSFALIEKTKGNGFLVIEEVNGAYQSWRSSSESVITQKNGIITATFAFGDDLVAAETPATVRNTGTATRVNYYLSGDEEVVGETYSCEWTARGQEQTPIFGKTYTTEHFREKCANDENAFQNDYWVDSRGIVRQSRQFISKTVGYLSLQRIIE